MQESLTRGQVLPMRTPAESTLIERFRSEQTSLPGAAEARAEAFARFEKFGLPSKRVESWHYTDLRALMREVAPVAPDFLESKLHKDDNPRAMVSFMDGEQVDASGLPKGVSCADLASELKAGRVALGRAMGSHQDCVVDLNTAFANKGVVVRIEPGVSVPEYLYLPFVDIIGFETPAYIAPRIIIEVGAGASVTICEAHSGPDGIAYQKNVAVEMLIGDGAKVEHIRLNEAGDKALVLSTFSATLGEGAELMSLGFSSGGEVARHQSFVTFVGENAKLSLRGATMLKGRQHCDNTLVVDHAVPHGTSRELFRTVVDDEAQGVFQGKIIVRPDAQKTDGQMTSNAILLGDEAGMANKPELEIFADDVVCAHGATCGALEESQLFYLMSRGLPRAEAESLLIEAFLDETFEAISHDGIRDALQAKVSTWMKGRAK